MRRNWGETAMGFVVIAFALLFVAYALRVADVGGGHAGYDLSAKVGDAGALAPGAKVTIAGVKIGSVSSVSIDPKSYLAVIHLAVDGNVQIPSDSTLKITSDGLLGGAHIAIAPGGAADNLKPGAEIENTQGAVDLFGLIGQVMRPHTDAAPAAGAPSATASPAPAPSSAAHGGALPDM